MGALNCSLRCREVQSQTIKDNCGERNQMTCWIGRRTFGWCREGLKIWFLLRFSSNIGWPANFEHIRHKTLVFIDQTILRLHYYLAFNWVTFLGLCVTFPNQGKVFYLSTHKLLVTKLSWARGFGIESYFPSRSSKVTIFFWIVFGLALRKAIGFFQTWSSW